MKKVDKKDIKKEKKLNKKDINYEKEHGCIREKEDYVLKTYNGKTTTVRDLQLEILEIMDEIHRVCVKNNIEYGLMAGSALGIVNYKGFIPWDDDIDVIVPRKDWNKFIEAMKKRGIVALLTLSLIIPCFGTVQVQAQEQNERASHYHIYDEEVYVRTEQMGSYTHTYDAGYNPNTGGHVYKECFVICEREYYTWRCTVSGCYATNGSFYVDTETHGSCPE
jgi:hypothetical protein